jgi:hypothetical protein
MIVGGVPQLGAAPHAGTLGQNQLDGNDAAAPRVIMLEPCRSSTSRSPER